MQTGDQTLCDYLEVPYNMFYKLLLTSIGLLSAHARNIDCKDSKKN